MGQLKTRAQFRQELAEKGISINAWARMHGYATANVSAILNDDEKNPRFRCLRGEAHNIAVSMGLKRGVVTKRIKQLAAA